MTLPTFIVIGAMKAGTTSLWRYLRSHPDVFMPKEKELDFFVAEKRWSLGVEWYATQFAPGEKAAARGEASTNYSKHPLFAGVPKRMASIVPEVRLIYVVRDPIERMRAHYLHALAAGWERRPLERALLEEPQYLDTSRYASQIERYLEPFDRSQLLVVTAESLREDRAATVGRIYSHIGVDRSWIPPLLSEESHTTAEKALRRPSAHAAERLPGWGLARRLVPRPLRRAWGRRAVVSLDPQGWPVPAHVGQRLREALRLEVARLREFIEEDFDGWGIV